MNVFSRSVLFAGGLAISMTACTTPAATPASRTPTPVSGIAGIAVPAAIDAYLARTTAFGISGAFLLASNGEVVVNNGVGLADRERGVPVTVETVFDIGSITKQFTAAAILKLEEQGRLRVEDSITRFLSDVPASHRGITLHHLLTHTSGLIGDLGGDYMRMPRDSMLRLALASDLQWSPGTRYEYSNLGYSVLGAVVEIASGQPYELFLREQLFNPARMTKTGYRRVQWGPQEVAVGYQGSRRWGTPLDHAWADDGPWWNLRANGGILSTTGDLYRWHRALESDVVLSAESRKKLFAPHVAEDADGQSHYGYGWAVSTTARQTRLIAHNGGNGYFFADFRRYVDDRVVAIVATNDASQQMELVQQRILAAWFAGRAPTLPPVASAQLPSQERDQYAGSYALPSDARVVVTHSDGRLLATPLGQHAVELLAGLDDAASAELRDVNKRALIALESAQRDDRAALRAASESPDRSEATLQRIWRTAEENQGPFRSLDVMGTINNWWGGASAPVTFVRLNFERGSRLFRLHWQDGKIVGYGGFAIASPAPTTLLAQGDHRFIGYNLGIEHPVVMRFELEGDAIASMVVETPGGTVRAVRER